MTIKLEWQPIETAPKDGTDILAHLVFRDGGSGTIQTVFWRDEGARASGWYLSAIGSIGPLDQTGDEDDDQIATHWMPLPESPK